MYGFENFNFLKHDLYIFICYSLINIPGFPKSTIVFKKNPFCLISPPEPEEESSSNLQIHSLI